MCQIEMYCEDCGSRARETGGLASARICPVCGGRMVGIRFYRNRFTRKVQCAERVD